MAEAKRKHIRKGTRVVVMTAGEGFPGSDSLELYSDPDYDNTKCVWLEDSIDQHIEVNTVLVLECVSGKAADKINNFRRWRIVDDNEEA